MDNGIWSTWYNLPPDVAEDHVHWLHEQYLPWVKQQPGIAWVAHYRSTGGGPAMRRLMASAPHAPAEVPQGGEYLFLAGAPAVHAFFNPFVVTLALPPGFAGRLSQRLEARDEFYVEESRVDGASGAARSNGQTPAPAIQFGTYRMRTVEAEFYLGEFNTQSRFPAMAQQPGCVRVRKLANVAGWPKHGVLYEFDSLEARLKNHEEPLEAQTLKPDTPTGRNTANAIYAPGSPFVGQRTWPPTD